VAREAGLSKPAVESIYWEFRKNPPSHEESHGSESDCRNLETSGVGQHNLEVR